MTTFSLPPLPSDAPSGASAQQCAAVLAWLQQIAPPAPTPTASAAVQLCADSRRVLPGDIFFAFPGDAADGRLYIADAVERGARAVVYEAGDFAWDQAIELPHLGVPGLKPLSGVVANAYYAHPDRDMFSVAVTGTNGKTSCAYWLANALSQQKPPGTAAMVGTLGVGMFVNGLPSHFDATGYTTPDAVLLQRKLAELRSAHVAGLALEASSIGLAEGRLNGMHIDVALFTNLTRDHLDYHGDMATYGAAKVMLFDRPELRHGVLNLDDPFGMQLAQRLQQRGIPAFGYSLGDAALEGVPVLRASAIKFSGSGTAFHVDSPFGTGLVKSRLAGQFNVSNLLGVMGVLLAKGLPWENVVAVAAGLSAAPGRMQQFGGQDAPLIVIDYAHTPDAMQKTLATLREVADQRRGKLWCVFGCGGDRDKGKRPEMGQASEAADEVILTSDNPRNEDPRVIIEQIRQGMQARTPRILEDRAAAILWAVRHAGKTDVVLLAGKGHEMYQEAGGKKLPFLDADHASLALAARATMMGGA